MSISSISDEFSLSPIFDEDLDAIKGLAQKTHSLWGKVYDSTAGSLVRVVHVIRNAIGSFIRDAFFFPLKCSLIANVKAVRDQMQIEENYDRDFWDPAKPLDLNFKDQASIRELFSPPEDRVIPIRLKSGKSVEITCRIIETKAQGEPFYNFAQISGIYGTISNNIAATYPYLSAYLNAGQDPLPPARFISISENNLNFKPATIDEAGEVILGTLSALNKEFGQMDQLVANSLGNVFLANALKQVEDPQILPKHICLDRGPSSIREVSKKYFWGLGRLIYFLAEFGRWGSELERDIVQFCHKWEERPSLLITGVKQDHHFSGNANLCLGEKIKKVEGVEILVFDPPRQIVHQMAHHNLRPDYLNSCYLVEESEYIKSSETLPAAILRHSLPAAETANQEIA